MLDSELAKELYIRDRWQCRHCKNRNGLHPHHVEYASQQGEDALNNLLTLCHTCHRGHHDGKLKIVVIEILENDLVVQFHRMKGWRPTW